jgi:uncharacterized protein YukE
MAESWIGGDTATLHALADALRPGKSRADTVVSYIDQDVRKISQDEGWTGDAATAFATHWEIASVATSAVGTFANAAAEVLTTLAGNLDKIDTALKQAAADARADGAPIGADGHPPTGPLTAEEKLPSDWYVGIWNQAQQEAQGFRVDADRDMLDVLHQIMKIVDGDSGEGLGNADKVALADYIRGIGAIPAAIRTTLDGRAHDADAGYQKARAAWLAARKATPPGQAMPSDVKLARSGALRDLNALKNQLDALDHQSHPVAKFLDINVGDVVGAIPKAGAAFTEAADGSKSLSFLSDVPVVDVAAAGLGTYFQATDDISKGESPTRAIAEDATSNVAGIAAGVAVGGAIIAGVSGAPVVVAGAAAVVGGAVAVGVGDLVYEGFHEHWDEDIQQDGVVGGIAAGTGHMFVNTGKDLGHMAEGIGHGAKSLWHGVFG